MARIAYRLWSDKTVENVENSFLFDVDEGYLRKSDYIKSAKKYTARFNKEFGTNHTYEDLFGAPVDIGYRYCSKCDTYYWDGEPCECDD